MDPAAYSGFMTWPLILAVLSVVVLITRFVLVRREADAIGNRTVAVAFAPPRSVTPGVSGALLRDVKAGSIVPAELLDLAVRGVWQVGVREDDAGQKVWFVQRDDTVEPELPPVPQALYRAIFPPGSFEKRVELNLDPGRSAELRELPEVAHREAVSRGWVRPGRSDAVRWTGLVGFGITGIGLFTLLNSSGLGAGLSLVAMILGVVTQTINPRPWVLTDEGRRVTDELDGLKLYMTAAEADRMKMLQAPETIDRLPALAHGPGEIAKLNERLLPYAVLFGILPQWSEVVKHSYVEAEQVPGWLVVADAVGDLMWLDLLTGGGFDMFGALGDFTGDVDAGMGLEGADGMGELGGGDLGDGGGLADLGGGDGGGLFDFDFDF